MLERNVHHIPVLSAAGQVLGVVDDGDRELGGRWIVARPAETSDGERLPSRNILRDERLAVVVVDIQQERQRALVQLRHRLQKPPVARLRTERLERRRDHRPVTNGDRADRRHGAVRERHDVRIGCGHTTTVSGRAPRQSSTATTAPVRGSSRAAATDGAAAAATPVHPTKIRSTIRLQVGTGLARSFRPGAGDRLHPTRRRGPSAAARPVGQTLPLAGQTGCGRRRKGETIVPRLDDSSTV